MKNYFSSFLSLAEVPYSVGIVRRRIVDLHKKLGDGIDEGPDVLDLLLVESDGEREGLRVLDLAAEQIVDERLVVRLSAFCLLVGCSLRLNLR